jgi:hypothetical protein
MVLYICKKCNKEFNRKDNYNTHLNKKFPCIKNISKKNNDIKLFHNIPNNSILFQNTEKNTQCKFCSKNYSTIYNLNKHFKICKIKKQNEDDKEKIFKQLVEKNNIIEQLLIQNKTLMSQVAALTNTKCKKNTMENCNNNNTTTTNSNNTTNNIIMMDFGKEDLQIIDKSEFIKIVNNSRITGVKITDELLKAIHFNDKYPQLNNIYISDINRNKCMIVENNQWKLSPVDQIPKVIDNIVKYSYDNNEQLSQQYKDNKSVINRLKIIEKYTKLADTEHLNELIDNEASKKDVQRCKNFQQHTYDTIKTTLYNEGKKHKSTTK